MLAAVEPVAAPHAVKFRLPPLLMVKPTETELSTLKIELATLTEAVEATLMVTQAALKAARRVRLSV